MSVELQQFHDAFFEESFEALDTMEAALLKLDVGAPSQEQINTVFRVAHSIKGGSAMFGFGEITSFTHTLETLLDALRAGRMEIKQHISDMLLRSVDVLRDMLRCVHHKTPIDVQRVSDLQFDLEVLVARRDLTATGGTVPSQEPQPARWRIRFEPGTQLLLRGNEPIRMFAELAGAGALQVDADASGVPALSDLDPEVCYLRWNLVVPGTTPRERLDEAFDWSAGDCELEIEAEFSGKPGDTTPDAAQEPGTDSPSAAQAVPTSTGAASAGEYTPEQTASGRSVAAETGSIRVGIEKIDELLNSVGEVVITQSMLMQIGLQLDGPMADRLRSGLSQLERNVRELQESVMQVRMLPISFVFNRLPRLVRDLGKQLGKRVQLEMSGESTELDKTVLERIGDPLVHLVRNSIDHGIEMPGVRAAAGKQETGTISLHAYHKGGNIILEVSDDGAGLNRDRILQEARERGLIAVDEEPPDERVYNLIFQPGFSTAEEISAVSGRGVGMDVVRRNIMELGGHVQIVSSPGAGSTVRIRLPLTLAILDGQLIRIGAEVFVVPLISIVQTIQVGPERINRVAGSIDLLRLGTESIPVLRLSEVFDVESDAEQRRKQLLTIVEADGQRVAVVVDELLAQQQVVIKSLEANFRQLVGVSGATMLADGRVALILDIPGLIGCFEAKIARASTGHADSKALREADTARADV
jgi:two-component system, chemotaxis family, sensor kinase CheA